MCRRGFVVARDRMDGAGGGAGAGAKVGLRLMFE